MDTATEHRGYRKAQWALPYVFLVGAGRDVAGGEMMGATGFARG